MIRNLWEKFWLKKAGKAADEAERLTTELLHMAAMGMDEAYSYRLMDLRIAFLMVKIDVYLALTGIDLETDENG